MSLDSHISNISRKVKMIDAKIHEAYIHHDDSLTALKKQKLRLLDEMQACKKR